jgi:hypothetical protein
MIAVVNRGGCGGTGLRAILAVLAMVAGLATIAIGILTNIGTTQPLPGLLRSLQHGSRVWVALGLCAVVFILATIATAVLAL